MSDEQAAAAWKPWARFALAGVVLGVVMAALVWQGNPGNAGICGACFLRDWAGALNLHQAAACRYVRPEVAGVVLGALLAAFAAREFRPRGGGAPMSKLFLGAWVGIGAMVFLGCPFRLLQRLGGGDLNAAVGLGGLLVGIAGGLLLTRRGYGQGRSALLPRAAGLVFPALVVALLVAMVAGAGTILKSEKPPGSTHAPWLLSLGGGLVAGVVMQRLRYCTMGAFREAMFYRDFHMLTAVLGLVAAFGVVSAATGKFELGFEGQPIAHADHVWNFLAMALTGLASSLVGGCPVRQLVLAGEGDTGAATAVVGIALGGALAHSLALVSSGAGPTPAGKVAVLVGLACCVGLALASRPKEQANG